MRRHPSLASIVRPPRLLVFLCLFALTVFLFNSLPVRLAISRLGHTSALSVVDQPSIHTLPPDTSAFATPTSNTAKMASAPFSLSTSLAQKKKLVQERLSGPVKDDAPIMLIMGNEAGDTDSMASAVLLSHLLSSGGSHSNAFPRSTTFVPLIQQQRRDLPLRAENQFLLSLLHISPADLLFMDDLPPLDSLRRSDLLLGLTDHPRLSANWQPYDYFESRVELVVDHHADDGAHKQAKLRVLKGPGNGAVGSASSVVVDLFKGEKQIEQLAPSLADLALAAILIDTDNLRPMPRGKATEVDLEAAHTLLQRSTFGSQQRAQFLQNAAQISGMAQPESSVVEADMEEQGKTVVTEKASPSVLRAAAHFFEILSNKKLDVSRLDSHALLRRDYKESVAELDGDMRLGHPLRAGFSSVPVGLSDWVHEQHGDGEERWAGFWKLVREWMRERDLDIAVVGTSFREMAETGTLEERAKNAKHRRELVLAYVNRAPAKNLFPSLKQALEGEAYSASLGGDEIQRLELEAPWKGSRRMASTGKRERLGGVDVDGKCAAASEAGSDVWVSVWRQRNARASRKM